MLVIDQAFSTDPYFNLALEEYLFKKTDDDVFMLWQNHNAIVIGKHQNTYREINLDFVNSKGVDVVRRLSGGGTVYHDLGNLNFTFIQNGQRDKLVDFTRFVTPIIECLKEMGLDASQGKRNEILLSGLKISGNAEHTFKSRVLHHGTLLFNSNLDILVESLKVNPFKYRDKAIQSVQSKVTNISDHLDDTWDLSKFREFLLGKMMEKLDVEELHVFSKEVVEDIKLLAEEKYQTWKWNFGYSPNYELNRKLPFNGTYHQVNLNVKRGVIESVSCVPEIPELEGALVQLEGQEHEMRQVGKILSQYGEGHLAKFFF